MNVTVIGTGYVGLVTGVMLSLFGNKVYCVGRNKKKIQDINQGMPPFFESGLQEALKKVLAKKTFVATTNLTESLQKSTVTIIAVGTPTKGGKIDLRQIISVSSNIGRALRHVNNYHVVVVKSTVVPETTEKVIGPLIRKYSGKELGEFGLCMNPEFLREGNAINDAIRPDRIAIGSLDKKSAATYKLLYPKNLCPIIVTNLPTAEMIKYASNSLLATMISYSNEIARVCEKISGVDVVDVWEGLHLDSRLSPVIKGKRIRPGILSYIYSGCGYGGSCFPKDTKALSNFARRMKEKMNLLETVIRINETQPHRVILLLKDALADQLKNKKVAVLGLSFKPDTDDIRETPAIPIINELLSQGADVVCHDPQAYQKGIPELLKGLPIKLMSTVEEALKGADAVLVLTAWKEYKKIMPTFFKKLMNSPILIDGRRIYDASLFKSQGIIYRGIGYYME